MLSLLGILPILQALSCLATIWGVAHVSGTTDTVITYGAGADGPTAMEWINSFGSIAIGVVGWVGTHWAAKKQGATSELLLAFAAWVTNRNDPATIRRLAFAGLDLIETLFVPKSPEDAAFVAQAMGWLRAHFAAPQAVVLPPSVPTK